MSTRGVVLFAEGSINPCYEVYYRHTDTYPRWLGVKLAKLLKQGRSKAEIIRELRLENYKRVAKPENVYPRVQADLEWIYIVELGGTAGLEILKTSFPDLIDGPDFVFSVWCSYVQYFPEDIEQRMVEIGRTARTVLRGLAAYHAAIHKPERQGR